jgi:GT2 family glycosyltransferase
MSRLGMNGEVCIIILNWNRWQDTIECLESIQQLDHLHYRMLILDNGSTDYSMEQIKGWAVGKHLVKSRFVNSRTDNKGLFVVNYDRCTAENGGIKEMELKLSQLTSSRKLVIVDNKENLGFAAGCNVGIKYALSYGAHYVWLLNNDTVVVEDSLSNLVNTFEMNAKYQVLTPQIRYYDNPMKIWNCGGNLTWYGTRKYSYANKNVNLVPKHETDRKTFITGCALLARASVFRKLGLLTERFFMGEEDFEFSQRLKMHGYKMACRYDAIIYHKVSVSFQGANFIDNVYIYYLNRFINMRFFWPNFHWKIWRLIYAPYIFIMLKVRYNLRTEEIGLMIKNLFLNSIILDRVNRETFMQSWNVVNEKTKNKP